MSIYRFRCSECGEEIKIYADINQAYKYADIICESCGEGKMERMIPRNISSIYNGKGYTKSAKKGGKK